MAAAIQAQGITKSFGKVQALRGVDLSVEGGTILGLLGPNGAGKTTLVRILATLLRPSAGSATVAGLDVAKQGRDLRGIIGLAGQYAAVDEHLTGRENLMLVARLYHMGRAQAKERAAEMLDHVGLTADADRVAKGYSGGMRRRLDLAASLIGDPQVIFLDEPTSGLDPPSRLALWALIEKLRAGGKTILLTTQYLEEADRLADRIAVVDKGRIIAEGTSSQLKAQVGGDVVEVTMPTKEDAAAAAKALKAFGPQMDASRSRVRVAAPKGAQTLGEVVRKLDKRTLALAEVALRRPTLDDVFLALTGHAAEEAPANGDGGAKPVPARKGEAKRGAA